MPTLIERIASWEDDCAPQGLQLAPQESIATEADQGENPAWEECIDALLELLGDESAMGDESESRPNYIAITSALAWIAFFRNRFPGDPPTCITPEPDGGIIVERRGQIPDGHDIICELTFYNSGAAERADYVDGRIIQMNSIPSRPQDWSAST